MPARSSRRGVPSNAGASNANRSSRSNTSTAPPTPTIDATAKAAIRESIKVDTNVPSVDVNPALLDRLSPSVRGVAEHAAVLRSVLARLGPIYDLVEREASRITEVSPFLAGKDQVRHTNVARISGTDLLYRPGGRSERSFGRRGPETRTEDHCHQGND